MSEASRDQNFVPSALGTSSVDGVTTVPFKVDPLTGRLLTDTASGSGTVTSVSVVSANGFAGTVANPTTTPAITLTTTITGILSGNGTAISAAAVTGSGSVVLATSPTLSNPTVGTQVSSDNSTLAASTAFVTDAITTAVIGLLDYRGSYNASTNLFPATGGSGTLGAILKGDFWICSVGGTLGGTAVTAGDLIIAIVDTPGQTASNWDLIAHDLGSYVTSITGTANQVIASASTGAVTLSLPQSIATTSNPQFATIELGAASDTTLSRSSAGVLAVEGVVIPSISSTNTLTNKRVTRRVVATTQSATPTINTDNGDIFEIVGLGQAITSMTTNLSGTPNEGDLMQIIFKDDGTARGITWGASFVSSTVALPTTTVISTQLAVLLQWRSSAVWTSTSAWNCIAVA